MLPQLKPALVFFILFTVVTGVLYPAAVTGLAQVLFPAQANGSIIEINGELYGSALIGQGFREPKYFWPRPSTTAGHAYNAFDPIRWTGSSGSNLGPLSQTLIDSVRQRVAALRAAAGWVTRPSSRAASCAKRASNPGRAWLSIRVSIVDNPSKASLQ